MAGLSAAAAVPPGRKKVSWWQNRGAKAAVGRLGPGWPVASVRPIRRNPSNFNDLCVKRQFGGAGISPPWWFVKVPGFEGLPVVAATLMFDGRRS